MDFLEKFTKIKGRSYSLYKFQELFNQLMSDIQLNQIFNKALIKQLLDFFILEFSFHISVMMMKSKFLKKLN